MERDKGEDVIPQHPDLKWLDSTLPVISLVFKNNL